jgi:hypothetical protein
VSPKDIEFGISRMFEASSGGDSFVNKVFRSTKLAEKWIKQNLDGV